MNKLYWIVCEEGRETLFEGRHQARTRGAALKFLKEQINRSCLRGVVFTITEIPVPLIREIVTEVLGGMNHNPSHATSEPKPEPEPLPTPSPEPVAGENKPGNPGFGDEFWGQVREHWSESRSIKQTAIEFGLSPNTVKTRARREGWKAAVEKP